MNERNCCAINYKCTMDIKSMDCKYYKRVNGRCYFSVDEECCNLKAQTDILNNEINDFFDCYNDNIDQTTEQLIALLLNKAINENLSKEITKETINETS